MIIGRFQTQPFWSLGPLRPMAIIKAKGSFELTVNTWPMADNRLKKADAQAPTLSPAHFIFLQFSQFIK